MVAQKPVNKSYDRLYIKTNHVVASTILHAEIKKNGRSEAAARLVAVTVARPEARRLSPCLGD